MGLINDKEKYKIKQLLNKNDYLIGTCSETGETFNFTMDKIREFANIAVTGIDLSAYVRTEDIPNIIEGDNITIDKTNPKEHIISANIDLTDYLKVDDIVIYQEGTNISIDNTNPKKPVINASIDLTDYIKLSDVPVYQEGEGITIITTNPLRPVIKAKAVDLEDYIKLSDVPVYQEGENIAIDWTDNKKPIINTSIDLTNYVTMDVLTEYTERIVEVERITSDNTSLVNSFSEELSKKITVNPQGSDTKLWNEKGNLVELDDKFLPIIGGAFMNMDFYGRFNTFTVEAERIEFSGDVNLTNHPNITEPSLVKDLGFNQLITKKNLLDTLLIDADDDCEPQIINPEPLVIREFNKGNAFVKEGYQINYFEIRFSKNIESPHIDGVYEIYMKVDEKTILYVIGENKYRELPIGYHNVTDYIFRNSDRGDNLVILSSQALDKPLEFYTADGYDDCSGSCVKTLINSSKATTTLIAQEESDFEVSENGITKDVYSYVYEFTANMDIIMNNIYIKSNVDISLYMYDGSERYKRVVAGTYVDVTGYLYRHKSSGDNITTIFIPENIDPSILDIEFYTADGYERCEEIKNIIKLKPIVISSINPDSQKRLIAVDTDDNKLKYWEGSEWKTFLFE